MSDSVKNFLITLFTSGMSSLATYLSTKGYITGEGVAAILAISGFIANYFHVKSVQAGASNVAEVRQSPGQSGSMMKLLAVALGSILLTRILTGCSTTPAPSQTAANAMMTIDQTAKTAMTGWGNYVAANHPGTNAETAVAGYFYRFKAVELLADDATLAWLSFAQTNTSATNMPTTAVSAQVQETQALNDLINAISHFMSNTN